MNVELWLIGFALTIMGHIATFVWWAGNMNSRMKHLEDTVNTFSAMPERMARMETQVSMVLSTTQETNKSVHALKDMMVVQLQQDNKRLRQQYEGTD